MSVPVPEVDSTFSDIPEVPKTYRELLLKANISKGELVALCTMRPMRVIVDYALSIALVFLVPLAYLLFPHPAILVLCVLANIHTFNRFAQIIHGSDHGGLFANPKANAMFGNVAASFVGYTRTGHQVSHQQHHLHLNTELDSDRIWGKPEESIAEIRRMWLNDIFMLTAIKRLLQYSQTDRKIYEVAPWQKLSLTFFINAARVLWPVAITQLVVLAYYTMIIGPQFYFLIYVLPIFTLYPAQIRLRTAVEHAFDAGYVPQGREAVWVARSVNASWLERLIIAPLDIPYHFEHHLLPGVPYYNLSKVRKLLEAKGFPVPIAPGYFGFMRAKSRSEQGMASA